MSYTIRVVNTYEHKYLRMDKWGTPVLTDVESESTEFESKNAAINIIERFKLYNTGYVHEVLYNNEVLATCSFFINNGKPNLSIKHIRRTYD